MRDSNFLIENNARHLWHPMAHPAEMQAKPPRIINAGEGVSVVDIHGKTVLDAVGGLWNVNLGYSCEPVKKAIRDQLDELPYYSTFRGTTNSPLIELSYELAAFFREDGLTRAFFTSGGSDSVETALRLARQFHKINGQPERTKFVALKKGYHGTHFGGASVNGNANFRLNYEPLLPGVFHLAAPYPYRNPFNTADPAEIAQAIARQFEDEIAFQGADTIAAFIMEPVLGAGGVIVPHETFMPLMRAICDRHGILLIADEVITAFGRTGAWTGSRGFGVKPDMMTTAKAITNGYFPFGAVMIADKVAGVFEANRDSFGTIGHGYTYSGHPVACAAGIATLDIYRDEGLFTRGAALQDDWHAAMHSLKGLPHIIDIRTIGLIAGIELAPREGAPGARAYDVFVDCFEKGLLIRVTGDIIAFSPPLIAEKKHFEDIVSILGDALKRAA